MAILLVIVSLSLLILVHEAGHFFAAKIFGVKVEEFGFGFPPKILSKKVGETVYSLNLLPFGGFVKIYGEDPNKINEAEKNLSRSFFFQKAWKKSVIILSGVAMNIILGWFAISAVFMVGSPEHLAITQIAPNSPAAEAGLKKGDFIIEAVYQNKILVDPIKTDDFVKFIQQNPEGPFTLKVKRGEEELTFVLSGRVIPPEGEGSLGVILSYVGFEKKPFFSALTTGFFTTIQALQMIILAFVSFIAKVFITPAVVETLTGPVGIFMLATEAGSLGFVYLLQLLALISLNLAVLNLIPFPALDGGRFLLVIVEKIKGSTIPANIQTAINTFGFILLIILMVVVTVKDVGRFLM